MPCIYGSGPSLPESGDGQEAGGHIRMGLRKRTGLELKILESTVAKPAACINHSRKA